MDTMEYKGYRGAVRYSADDHIREAVDGYLTLCEKLGRNPDRE